MLENFKAIIKLVFYVLVFVVLFLATIYIQLQVFRLKPKEVETRIKIDTVYIEKSYEVTKPYDNLSLPSAVAIYSSGLDKDTYFGSNKTKKYGNSNPCYSSPSDSCITHDSNIDRVLEFKLKANTLEVASTEDSVVKVTRYDLDLSNYQYLYDCSGELTSKKLSVLNKIKPYARLTYTPLQSSIEGSLGIQLSTKSKVSYQIGIFYGYYHNLSSKPQKGIEISLQYNL